MLPPHVWDGLPDETLPPLALTARGQSVESRDALAFLSNSFGFGGSNCAVILTLNQDNALNHIPKKRP